MLSARPISPRLVLSARLVGVRFDCGGFEPPRHHAGVSPPSRLSIRLPPDWVGCDWPARFTCWQGLGGSPFWNMPRSPGPRWSSHHAAPIQCVRNEGSVRAGARVCEPPRPTGNPDRRYSIENKTCNVLGTSRLSYPGSQASRGREGDLKLSVLPSPLPDAHSSPTLPSPFLLPTPFLLPHLSRRGYSSELQK